ncbi:MoaB/Mog domain-containing protein [Jimgerdemannia flammicorona]|uniref:MoaB/Mog domain-containing protein n=1 Tax=Jimgerdemannia flammicorona TaxID=994334 RepID=A0A433CWW5_9FUNG|nr:MoaB/Mog domain-containing protein [Jimgerdemannia flammicorona]
MTRRIIAPLSLRSFLVPALFSSYSVPTRHIPLTAIRHLMSTSRQKDVTAACLIIGDEILNGKTRDSNSNFLAKYLFGLGVELKRIEVIPDEQEDIAETVRKLSSKYNLVFTSGGIGSTHDDITYPSIAYAYNLPLALHTPTAKRMGPISTDIPNWSLTPERKRMATFPDPSRVVHPCDDLWVPIVIVNSNIHILPGIPEIFESLLNGFRPHLLEVIGRRPTFHRAQIATSVTEGAIAAFLAGVQERVKAEGIKIGSYPNWEPQNGVSVVVSVVGRDEARVKEMGEEIRVGIDGWPFILPEAEEAG